MARRAIFAWLFFIPVAIANAAVRESLVKPIAGDLRAHQISSVTGSLVFLAVAYALLHRPAKDAPDAKLARIGLAWLGGTVLFEFGFGHFVMGNPWSKLLHDYDLGAGRIWSLVLVVITVAPLLVKRIALWRSRGQQGTRSLRRQPV